MRNEVVWENLNVRWFERKMIHRKKYLVSFAVGYLTQNIIMGKILRKMHKKLMARPKWAPIWGVSKAFIARFINLPRLGWQPCLALLFLRFTKSLKIGRKREKKFNQRNWRVNVKYQNFAKIYEKKGKRKEKNICWQKEKQKRVRTQARLPDESFCDSYYDNKNSSMVK